MIRNALLVLVFVLIGTISAATDADMTTDSGKQPSNINQLTLVSPEGKRLLRQGSVKEGGVHDATEERAFIVTPLKNSLYRILAAFGLKPQTLYVQLGIRTGMANALYNRLYHSYHRWYATYGPRVYG
ncbi:secreted RxLR effector peptide protein, putative [Phytophthora infestans T30-4]|uniref:RxLR effector protein CRE6 n=2 Tax=Phytophthora infestans TaxID=4787 RepID=CRE6_PHYIT|nr:secreted RxLR effector peptide protein, putative [Phytophthora infestans T30-4]D0N8F5.1 RecName: Full=RxLR effector protein CRE6; AltName: Full=Core RXLR effector 6; Flags: Precursor [Phytophthora infestans T30-4]EEY53840.1 secreted RxLR effector peptide protein, putative [Phytophthora infestans T30-4]KAF4033989.1 hypothetical protein GN244_ATG14065 [Phytophthora infestans]KAF4147514.1 hypothetical protein GN958_ATG03284 [Phytophthora infestans]|eukprot:XP_002904471.1 secreted RxLR effector peptide protein, putative [Phytophthora infestans T30-4]